MSTHPKPSPSLFPRRTPATRAFTPRHRPHGFTLIEIICVLAILAVLAGLIVPRITPSPDRAARAEAVELQRMLTAFAQRDIYASDPIALQYDDATSRLSLYALRRNDFSSGGKAAWTEDRIVPAITLETLQIKAIHANGSPIKDRRWRIELSQTFPRPDIVLELSRAGAPSQNNYIIDLAPRALAARLTPGSTPPRDTGYADLDAQGRGEDAW